MDEVQTLPIGQCHSKLLSSSIVASAAPSKHKRSGRYQLPLSSQMREDSSQNLSLLDSRGKGLSVEDLARASRPVIQSDVNSSKSVFNQNGCVESEEARE